MLFFTNKKTTYLKPLKKFSKALKKRLPKFKIFRPYVIAGIFNLIFMVIVFRFAYVGIFPGKLRDQLRSQGSRQAETKVVLASERGTIADRLGTILATSTQSVSVFAFPRKIPKNKISFISKEFSLPENKIRRAIKEKRNFLWVKRKIPKNKYKKFETKVKEFDFLHSVEEPLRLYPHGHLASHILGFVGMDNEGLGGLEYTLNQRLQSESSQMKVARDARGQMTLVQPSMIDILKPLPKVDLTLDYVLQKITEKNLEESVKESHSLKGTMMIIDVPKREILSLASYPNFEPQDPYSHGYKGHEFHGVSSGLELGSILKPIVISCALQAKVITPEERIFCENGKYEIEGGVLHDTHPYAWLSLKEVLKFSSNIGMFKIAQKMGKKRLFACFAKAGVLQPLKIGIPGEWKPSLSNPKEWKMMRFANLAFGQGIAMSPLQFMQAFVNTITGKIQKLKIIQDFETPPQESFGSVETAKWIRKALKDVVEEGGTGSKGRISFLQVGGKTGTAQKFDGKSYSERVSSFVSFAPYQDPKFSILLVLDEPQGTTAYGGVIAAPYVAKVMEQTFRYFMGKGKIALKSGY